MSPLPLKTHFLEQVSAAQIVQMFDLVADFCFFVKDSSSRFVALNSRACEYCGVRTEHEALGKTDYDFFPKSRADDYIRDDRLVMRTGQVLVNRIEGAPEPAGSPRLVSTTKVPLRDAIGQIIGVMGFSRPLDQVRERTSDADRMAKVIEHMHHHPASPMRTSELARLVGLSPSQFDRCFRATFNTTAHHYLTRVRVEAACRLLAESNTTVAAIALDCGFYDHAHLAHSFRQVMNTTPSAYRHRHQKPVPSAIHG